MSQIQRKPRCCENINLGRMKGDEYKLTLPFRNNFASFVKRWQRYVAALLELIRQCPDDPSAVDARSERLALASNRLAHNALSRLEEVTLLECEGTATGSACVALLMFGDDELTPYLYFLEDGLCGLGGGTRSGGSL